MNRDSGLAENIETTVNLSVKREIPVKLQRVIEMVDWSESR
jgi:hypothetical protein